jgi:hypothetical protein
VLANRQIQMTSAKSSGVCLGDEIKLRVAPNGRLSAHVLVTTWRGIVTAEEACSCGKADSLGANLLRVSCEQLQEAMIESKSLTEQEFQQDLKRLDEADYMRPSPVMWAA